MSLKSVRSAFLPDDIFLVSRRKARAFLSVNKFCRTLAAGNGKNKTAIFSSAT